MTASIPLDIRHTTSFEEAETLTAQGYEPIECAFGRGSVLGPLAMDHHGQESWREGVAIRAYRDHYGSRREDPRFVVTGTADADATLAILCLTGWLPKEMIPSSFPALVNRQDLDPIHIDLLEEQHGEELLYFQQLPQQTRNARSFVRAVEAMARLLELGLPSGKRGKIRRSEKRRIKMAEESTQEAFPPHVMYVEARVWGFDRWYRRAPLIVSYSTKHNSITIGCKDLKTAESLLGQGGLHNFFQKLGPGWGGRESIGGSPRGEQFTAEDAREVALTLQQHLSNVPTLEEYTSR